MATIEYSIRDLRNWVVGAFLRPNIQIMAAAQSSNESHFRARIFTASNSYLISAIERKEGRSYLGCIAQSTRSRPGEDWLRGNDLPDGSLSPKTWEAILAGIVRYELQAISECCKDNEGRPPKKQKGEPISAGRSEK